MSAQETSIAGLAPLLRREGIQIITFCVISANSSAAAPKSTSFTAKPGFPAAPRCWALTNRIPLLPVIVWFDGQREQVVLGAQIEPERFDGETLAQAAGRITAELVRFFEPFFRLNPEQWRLSQPLASLFLSDRRCRRTSIQGENS